MSNVLLLGVVLGAAALIAISAAPVGPTRRFAVLLAASAGLAFFSTGLAAAALIVLFGAASADAVLGRRALAVQRSVPHVLARGVPASLEISTAIDGARIRQPRTPDIDIELATADGQLVTQVTGRRRGRHLLPAPAVRSTGPVGLAAWYRTDGDAQEVLVYPDLPAARRLALAVRQGRFRGEGRLTRGPLGLGIEFEAVRDYLPDDDLRQVNWRATARVGRPMSNQYRVEQDRDIVCVLDAGRLMAAPIGDRTRLDAAVDAAVAVALVADELGDRCGVLAFGRHILRDLRPRRRGGDAVVRTIFDLEPVAGDADYEVAFQTVGGTKRAFVCVFTDLIDESAASALVDAMPALARRHSVTVASVRDPDLDDALRTSPRAPADVYRTAVALDVLDARARVVSQLRQAGANVVEAPVDALGAACVRAYLTAKSRGRL